MKAVLGFLSIILSASITLANDCSGAAEEAAYNAWFDASAWAIGDIQSGATDIVWERNGVISYQVSIMYRKPDSSTMSWANYSVRVRSSDCSVVKVRKF